MAAPAFNSLDELRSFARKIIGDYGPRNARMAEDESYYWNENQLKALPRKAVEVRPPSAHDLVEDFITAMTYKSPDFRHIGVSDSKTGQMGSERLTAFLNVYWDRLDRRKLYTHMIWYGLVRGAVCTRVVEDGKPRPALPALAPKPPDYPSSQSPDAIDEYAAMVADYNESKLKRQRASDRRRAEQNEELPIRVDLIDPAFVFPDPSKDPSYIFVRWERPVFEIRQNWPHVDTQGLDPNQKVTWSEYWDTEKFAYWVESFRGGADSPYRGGGPGLGYGSTAQMQEVKSGDWAKEPTRHGYGFLPFTYDGPFTRPVDDLNKRYYSVLTLLKTVFEQEAMNASQKATLIKNLAWAPIIFKSGRFRTFRLNLEPMEVTNMLPDEEASYLVPQLPIGAVDSAAADIQEIIARLTERGIGILITDHNVRETLAITDRAYILFDGKILVSGTATELADNPTAREIYLGEKFSL